MTGHVHSIQSLGALDGPGLRFTVFLAGCPLRCGCCHNPDTWEMKGNETTAEALVQKALRYREYFGDEGGVTLSGGEPLLQAAFAREVFARCHDEGINTCLDTSGCILNADAEALLDVTDRVLLDIKYTNDEQYRAHVGCGIAGPLKFLGRLQERGIATTLRQVVIPTLNDNRDNIRALAKMASAHSVVDKVELLPFRKICQVKYETMKIPFPFANIPEPTSQEMTALESVLASFWRK